MNFASKVVCVRERSLVSVAVLLKCLEQKILVALFDDSSNFIGEYQAENTSGKF